MIDKKMSNVDIQRKLQLVAKMIGSHECRGSDRDVYHVQHRQYDHHSNLHFSLHYKLEELDSAIKSFVEEMKNQNLWDDVTIVITSDFGRTLTMNTNGGTDHGWGGNSFILGGSVNGGRIFGEYPEDLSSNSPLNIGRGRLLPTKPWESVWSPVSEWLGVTGEEALNRVLPNRISFPSTSIFNGTELFNKGLQASPTLVCDDGGQMISCDPNFEGISKDTPSEVPSEYPSELPSAHPSQQHSEHPSEFPTATPSVHPSQSPSEMPSKSSGHPSEHPSELPSEVSSAHPSQQHSEYPSEFLSATPSKYPSQSPSEMPSEHPSARPSEHPSEIPSAHPSQQHSGHPSEFPTASPSKIPSHFPSEMPSKYPSGRPSAHPSELPSKYPSELPSAHLSQQPSEHLSKFSTASPSAHPSQSPSEMPSKDPSELPSALPSQQPSEHQSKFPTASPSQTPSADPLAAATDSPSFILSHLPSVLPSTTPSHTPAVTPSMKPSVHPNADPSITPTVVLSYHPSLLPTLYPSETISVTPSGVSSTNPTEVFTFVSSVSPSLAPSEQTYPSGIVKCSEDRLFGQTFFVELLSSCWRIEVKIGGTMASLACKNEKKCKCQSNKVRKKFIKKFKKAQLYAHFKEIRSNTVYWTPEEYYEDGEDSNHEDSVIEFFASEKVSNPEIKVKQMDNKAYDHFHVMLPDC